MTRIAQRTRFGCSLELAALLAAVLAPALIAGGAEANLVQDRVESRAAPEAEQPAGRAADSKNPHVWQPQTTSVAVFKNGLGFFMRQGDVSLRDGWCLASQIPPAAFGTLAIYAIDQRQSIDMVGSGPGEIVEFDGRDAPDDDAARRARLEPAIGLRAELRYQHHGHERAAAGKLLSVGPQFAVLDDDQQTLAVPISGLKRLQILDLPLRVHVAGDDKKPGARSKLGMAYLRKGITWIPDYTLEIVDEKTARLTLRGTLVNEAEDLIHTDVHLVVGVPHFVHTDYLAPVAVGQVIRTIGAAVAANVPQQAMTQQIISRAGIVSNAAVAPQFNQQPGVADQTVEPPGDLGAAIGNLPELAGPAGTDYTVYTVSDLTLRRGEKAILTLLAQTIRYGHVYRWSPPEKMRHFLVLHNDTPSAWTTGPCLAIDGHRPLSEDLLYYTPKSGKSELEVTTAINVVHEKSEQEVDRQLKIHSPSPSVSYDLVTLEGTLRIRNFDPQPVDILIDNPVPGKPTVAGGGQMSLSPDELKLAERRGNIRWSLKLKPAEEKTLTYRYERYVPSR